MADPNGAVTWTKFGFVIGPIFTAFLAAGGWGFGQIQTAHEDIAILKSRQPDLDRRLQAIEDKLDRLLVQRGEHKP